MIHQVEEEVSFTINTQRDVFSQSLGDLTQSPIQSQSQSLLAGATNTVRSRTIDPQPDDSILSLNTSMHEEMDLSPIRSQSQSLFAGLTTPTRISKNVHDDCVKDRFNGILYHVITSDGQVTIIFSTNDLYQKFLVSLKKELSPRRVSDIKSMYTTHILGKYCVVSSDDSAASLTATGPAHMLWRDTVFARMAIRLYQQYAGEMEEEISRSQIQHQTSTPAVSGLLVPESSVAPAETQQPQSNDQPVSYNIASSVIISQIAELQHTSKLLQEQLHRINTKIDTLLLSSQEMHSLRSPTIHELSDSTFGDKYLTLSTTGEMSPNLQITPGAATYSDVLTKGHTESPKPGSSNQPCNETSAKGKKSNVTKGKNPKQNGNTNTTPKDDSTNKSDANLRAATTPKQMTKNQQRNSAHTNQSRTLIIGDSILSGVNKRGLNRNVECLSVPGATIETINDKIQLYDISKFNNIVVYVGGNDAANNSDMEYFEEKCDQFMRSIKNKNAECEIFMCTSCPRGDTEVEDVNDVIIRLSGIHGANCVDANLAFYDKSHNLRPHFYKPRDNIHLSRSGVKRVLGTINEHTPIVDNFEKCVFASPSYTRPTTDNYGQDRNTNASTYGRYSGSRNTRENMMYKRPDQNNYDGNYFRGQFRQQSNGEYHNMQRCLKCGLTNHLTEDCRHESQLQCYKCKFYGHKDSSGLCIRK